MNWTTKETSEWSGEVASVAVYDYATGAMVGTAEVSRAEWDQYQQEKQEPQDICRADVLSPEDRVRLGLKDSQTIWMEE